MVIPPIFTGKADDGFSCENKRFSTLLKLILTLILPLRYSRGTQEIPVEY
jgi:hypothetical protein